MQLLRMESSQYRLREALFVAVFDIFYGFLREQPGFCRYVSRSEQRFVRHHVKIQLCDFFDRPARSLTHEFFYLPFDCIDRYVVLFSHVLFVKSLLHGTLKRSFEFNFFSVFVLYRQSDDHRQIPLDRIALFQFSFEFAHDLVNKL